LANACDRREHERITREVLSQHGAVEVKTMGDGLLADRGATALRGFEDPVRLFEVRWKD